MNKLVVMTRLATLAFLASLAAVVVLKFLSARVSLGGLLAGDHKGGSSYFSLGRTQLLVCTLVVAIHYLSQVAANLSTTSLPDLPTGTVELLGGSQLYYLAGKARALFDPSS